MTQPTVETLRSWSQVLLWVSIILPSLGALAAGARYYVERYEKSLISRRAAAEIRLLREAQQSAAAAVADQAARVENLKNEAELNRAELSASLETARRETAAAAERAAAAARKLQPRSISAEQSRQLVALLSAAPKEVLRILAPSTDPEAVAFATQLHRALTDAGWTVKLDQGVMQDAVTGVAVEVQDPSAVPQYAVELHKALVGAGLPVELFVNRNQNPGQVTIFVGHKP